MSSFIRIVLAFWAYGLLHSLLLTPSARLAMEAIFGQRLFRRWFRLLYSIQAAFLFLVFLIYAATLPDIELMILYGAGAWVLHGLRLAGLAVMAWALWAVGLRSFFGIENWKEGRRGRMPGGDGIDRPELVVRGPYRWVRHPMYAAGLVILWALPHWTVNILAFNLAATAYLWVGVRHEEARLRRVYGEAYRRYEEQTPRYLPQLAHRRVARAP